MNTEQKRILRVQRVRSLDQIKLDSLVVQLSTIETEIQKKKYQIEDVEREITSASIAATGQSVDQIWQCLSWVERLVACLADLQAGCKLLQEERDQMLAQIMLQKSKVKGWDASLDRLGTEVKLQLEKSESHTSDDLFLHRKVSR